MHCCITNIKNLMASGVRFQFPCYQRHYSWSENDCAVLLDDIQALAKEHSVGNGEVSHFMGSIVVQKDPFGANWQIIDGQQRLVTMYLFYLALAQAAKEHGAEGSALSDQLCITILGEEPKLIFPQSNQESDEISDQDALAAINSDDFSLEANEDDALSENPIVNNYRYFYNQLIEFDLSGLINLFKLTQYLELVEIDLDNHDKPQFIFESLNTKGEPLEEWDKIRNLVLMDLPSTDLERCYQKFWLPIENCVESDVESYANFVYYYLAAKEGLSSDTDRYAQLKEYIGDNCSNDKKALLESMLDYAESYACINNNEYLSLLQNEQETVSRSIKQMLQFLKAAFGSYWWHWAPFGMQCIMMYRKGKITADQLLKVLKLIDIFLVRSFVCNFKQREDESCCFVDSNEKYTVYLEGVFLSLCDEFKTLEPGNDFVNTVSDFLFETHRLSEYVTDWDNLPNNANERASIVSDDDLFYTNLDECPFFDVTPNYLRRALMYVIARLEVTNNNGRRNVGKKLVDLLINYEDKATIEHVMPQTLNDDWYDALGGKANAKKVYKTWIDRLANLTVLPQSENSSVGNSSFSEKLKCYKDNTLLGKSELVQNRVWKEYKLEERAKRLTELATEIWDYRKFH